MSDENESEKSLERSLTESSVSSQNTSEINVSSPNFSEKANESGSDAEKSKQAYTALARTNS